jgi:large repetitive protein
MHFILLGTLGCFPELLDRKEGFPDNPLHDYDRDLLTEQQGDCDDLDPMVTNGPWYADQDGDGFGNPSISTRDCEERIGYADNPADCNDQDGSVYPGNNNEIGELCILDEDGDGYGDTDAPLPYDLGTDCDDLKAASHPAALEICDGIDNDCNGEADELGAYGAQIWYLDADSDGFGDSDITLPSCEQPGGYSSVGTDCDDSTASTFLGAPEYCNGADDNCDGITDESDALDAPEWYQDGDNDGYGNPGNSQPACSQPAIITPYL